MAQPGPPKVKSLQFFAASAAWEEFERRLKYADHIAWAGPRRSWTRTAKRCDDQTNSRCGIVTVTDDRAVRIQMHSIMPTMLCMVERLLEKRGGATEADYRLLELLGRIAEISPAYLEDPDF